MNEKYKKDFLHAGALAGQVRAYGKALIVRGASYNGVMEKIYQKIKELDAIPAFPPQMALNDVAAHFLPFPGEDIIFSDQLVKLDVGICYKGAIGDCAVTVDLSGKYGTIINAAEAALAAAEKIIAPELPVREIGKVIEETIASYGLTSIKNLSGHGLGYNKIHCPPSIPNYADNSKAVLKPGMTFAIEPFATNGKGLIYEAPGATIFAVKNLKSAPTKESKMLLSSIMEFHGLPFSIHNLAKYGLPLGEIRQGLTHLLQAGIIEGYGPLVEEKKGMVAQAENSVLVDTKGKVFITTRL